MLRLMLSAAAILSSVLIATAYAQTVTSDIVVDDNMRAGRTFEQVAAKPAGTFCLGRPITVANATSRPLRFDLYEAQTDVGFPIDPIAPGATAKVDVVAPARIVAIDPVTGRALFLFTAEACI